MKRTHMNLLIDVLAFVGFLLLVSTGILLLYQLPPGSGRGHAGVVGEQAQEKTVSLLWGLSRHEWGDVHFYIALGLLVVLALHLLLHWKWIVCVVRGQRSENSGMRLALGCVGLVGAVLLAAMPLAAPVEQVPRSQLSEQGETEDPTVRGEMTLAQLEAQTGVPVAYVLKQLDLPESLDHNEQLGRLRREYSFEISDVRQIVEEYQAD